MRQKINCFNENRLLLKKLLLLKDNDYNLVSQTLSNMNIFRFETIFESYKTQALHESYLFI